MPALSEGVIASQLMAKYSAGQVLTTAQAQRTESAGLLRRYQLTAGTVTQTAHYNAHYTCTTQHNATRQFYQQEKEP